MKGVEEIPDDLATELDYYNYAKNLGVSMTEAQNEDWVNLKIANLIAGYYADAERRAVKEAERNSRTKTKP